MTEIERSPQVGDAISHEGHVAGYTITALTPRFDPETGKTVTVAAFENEGYLVACLASDLVWLPEDNAWHLPGRLLSGAERDLWAAHHGGPDRGRPADHVAARATLKAEHAVDHQAILQAQALERARHAQAVSDRHELRRLRRPTATPEQLAAAAQRRAPKEG